MSLLTELHTCHFPYTVALKRVTASGSEYILPSVCFPWIWLSICLWHDSKLALHTLTLKMKATFFLNCRCPPARLHGLTTQNHLYLGANLLYMHHIVTMIHISSTYSSDQITCHLLVWGWRSKLVRGEALHALHHQVFLSISKMATEIEAVNVLPREKMFFKEV